LQSDDDRSSAYGGLADSDSQRSPLAGMLGAGWAAFEIGTPGLQLPNSPPSAASPQPRLRASPHVRAAAVVDPLGSSSAPAAENAAAAAAEHEFHAEMQVAAASRKRRADSAAGDRAGKAVREAHGSPRAAAAAAGSAGGDLVTPVARLETAQTVLLDQMQELRARMDSLQRSVELMMASWRPRADSPLSCAATMSDTASDAPSTRVAATPCAAGGAVAAVVGGLSLRTAMQQFLAEGEFEPSESQGDRVTKQELWPAFERWRATRGIDVNVSEKNFVSAFTLVHNHFLKNCSKGRCGFAYLRRKSGEPSC
jgi:hypothetical protein